MTDNVTISIADHIDSFLDQIMGRLREDEDPCEVRSALKMKILEFDGVEPREAIDAVLGESLSACFALRIHAGLTGDEYIRETVRLHAIRIEREMSLVSS